MSSQTQEDPREWQRQEGEERERWRTACFLQISRAEYGSGKKLLELVVCVSLYQGLCKVHCLPSWIFPEGKLEGSLAGKPARNLQLHDGRHLGLLKERYYHEDNLCGQMSLESGY